MSGELVIVMVGNLTADVELKFVPSGKAVASFSIAQTPRKFNKASGEWEDGQTVFMNCTLWGDAAEHAVDSLTKGTRVIASGQLVQESYEKDGVKKTVFKLVVDEIGPSLRYASAKVTKMERSGTSGGGGSKSSSAGTSSKAKAEAFEDKPPFHHVHHEDI